MCVRAVVHVNVGVRGYVRGHAQTIFRSLELFSPGRCRLLGLVLDWFWGGGAGACAASRRLQQRCQNVRKIVFN